MTGKRKEVMTRFEARKEEEYDDRRLSQRDPFGIYSPLKGKRAIFLALLIARPSSL
jgi:hypothetical protein